MSVYDRKQSRGLALRTQEAIGTLQPPRISRLGNRFALIDGSGDRYEWPKLYLDVLIIDVNPHESRTFFPNGYDPDDSSPPLCFSDNGVAPSSRAQEPQSETCAVCPRAEWTSVSELTGKRKPACSKRQKFAVLVMDDPTMMPYLLDVPPKSLKVLSRYSAQVASFQCPGAGREADLDDVVTRVTFVPGVNGEIQFQCIGWLSSVTTGPNGLTVARAQPAAELSQSNPVQLAPDQGEKVAAYVDELINKKATEWIIGSNDKPWQAALPSPSTPLQISASPEAHAPAPLPAPAFQEAAATPAPLSSQGAPSGHGGARTGSGRPKGAKNKAIPPGITPAMQTAQVTNFPQTAAPPPPGQIERVVPLRQGGEGDPAALGAPAPISGDGLPDFLRRQEKPAPGFAQPEAPSNELQQALGVAFGLDTK